MFDNYYDLVRRDRADYVTKNVNVTHHHAPTIESVQLLRELEKEAENKHVEAMRLDDNEFRGIVEVYTCYASLNEVAVAHFKMNGKTLKVEARATPDKDKTQLFLDLRDEVAKVIASEMLSEMVVKW